MRPAQPSVALCKFRPIVPSCPASLIAGLSCALSSAPRPRSPWVARAGRPRRASSTPTRTSTIRPAVRACRGRPRAASSTARCSRLIGSVSPRPMASARQWWSKPAPGLRTTTGFCDSPTRILASWASSATSVRPKAPLPGICADSPLTRFSAGCASRRAS